MAPPGGTTTLKLDENFLTKFPRKTFGQTGFIEPLQIRISNYRGGGGGWSTLVASKLPIRAYLIVTRICKKKEWKQLKVNIFIKI